MVTLTAFFKYLKYLTRHRWYVFLECCKLGIPWRGLVHDLSKFLKNRDNITLAAETRQWIEKQLEI